jgi:hypothetical protein
MVPVLGLGPVKFEPCGVLRLAEHLSWWAEHGDGQHSRAGAAAGLARARPRLAWHLPVTDIPAAAPDDLLAAAWTDTVLAGREGHPVTATDTEIAQVAAAGTATLHVGGWQDLMVTETLRHHALTAGAGAPNAGPSGTGRPPAGPASMVIGPWGHDLAGLTEPCGDLGVLGAFLARWVTLALAGTAVAQIRVADLTTATWDAPACWPPSPAAAPVTRWATRTDTDTQNGDHPLDADGSLTPSPPPGQDGPEPVGGACRFTHDPADPHPSTGVGTTRRHPRRRDAVRWCTQPLTGAVTVDGAAVVHLRADADGPADWVLRLLDQAPDGTEVLLARGMLADTARVGTDVTLGAVRASLPVGHRLVLEVTGADFPHAARHLGRGTDPRDRYTGTDLRTVVQTVHTGSGGTRLDLPHAAPPPAPHPRGLAQ